MFTTHELTAATARNGTDQTFRPLLVADWVDAVFVHFALDPAAMRPFVPFPLDTRDGAAYVSLVAFTQRRLRPTVGGRLAEVLSTPLGCHEFLNVRTYVRVAGEVGIHFLAEWIPNRLAALIGPPMYGLPYRVGRLRYTCAFGSRGCKHPRRSTERSDIDATADSRPLPETPPVLARVGTEVRGTRRPAFSASVTAPGGRIEFGAWCDVARGFAEAPADTLDAFLVERYAAWTYRNGVARRFRIAHEPWPQARASVRLTRDDLLAGVCRGLLCGMTPTLAHMSPGAFDVRIGPPVRV